MHTEAVYRKRGTIGRPLMSEEEKGAQVVVLNASWAFSGRQLHMWSTSNCLRAGLDAGGRIWLLEVR